VPADLRDDAGRELLNASEFPLALRTAAFPPLAKFAARFGILELHAQPALPVTVRNLEPTLTTRVEAVTKPPGTGWRDLLNRVTGTVVHIAPDRPGDLVAWLRRVAVARRGRSVFAELPPDATPVQTLQLPKPGGAAAFEVVGIPLPTAGLYVV
jgi:hypothetical protein